MCGRNRSNTMKLVDNIFRRRPDAGSSKSYRVKGVKLEILDIATSIAPLIVHEISKNLYGFDQVKFAPGDVIIDIGGHVGIVSLYLAKKYPYIQVYAFEPTPRNYEYFVKNIELNGVTNIAVENLALTSDRRDLDMTMHLENTGGATSNVSDMKKAGHEHYVVRSISLDDVFERHSISRCKLIKIDCEGSEHEILRSTTILNRVDWIVGEFHINRRLEAQGYSIESLVEHVAKYIPPQRIRYEPCRMAE